MAQSALSCHIGNLNISDSSLLFAMQSRELKEMTILNIQTEATDPSLYHIQLSGGEGGTDINNIEFSV